MKLLGNLLLVLGTILGGIAAANSVRPWRWLSLEDVDAGQVLFEDVHAADAAEGGEPVAVADSALDPTVVASLRAAGVEKVKVKDPPQDEEVVPVDPEAPDGAIGRVLAAEVVLGTSTESVPAGRRFTEALALKFVLAGRASAGVDVQGVALDVPILPLAGWSEEAVESGLLTLEALDVESGDATEETLKTLASGAGELADDQLDSENPDEQLGAQGDAFDGDLAAALADGEAVRVRVDDVVVRIAPAAFAGWLSVGAESLPDDAFPSTDEETVKMLLNGSGTLAAATELSLPDVAEAGHFVDEPLARRMAGAGHATVSVKITRTFSWSDWSWKWGFLAALACMVLGIAAKRAESGGSVAGTAAAPEAPTATPRELLGDLERKVTELAGRAGELSAEEIHDAVDPLLTEECYVLTAGRGVLQAALGVAGFADVFGPYSTAERRLNRAWSAAVDGHAEEARAALQSAVPELGRALAALPEA